MQALDVHLWPPAGTAGAAADGPGDPMDLSGEDGGAGPGPGTWLVQFPNEESGRADQPPFSAARLKPRTGKLELEYALDQESGQFDAGWGGKPHVQPGLDLKNITLTSTQVAMKAKYMVGLVRGDPRHGAWGPVPGTEVFLTPVDTVAQLRASVAHLNAKKEATEKAPEPGPGAGGREEPELVQVQVQKRETSRQEQLRLQSHEYLRLKEQEEPWTPLKPRPKDHASSRADREEWVRDSGDTVAFRQSGTAYLDALIPPLRK